MFPLLAGGTLGRDEAASARATGWARSGWRVCRRLSAQAVGRDEARVAIARALAMQPEMLLMDEPFAALDALTRRNMQEELLGLWDEMRFTLLFVTHSIEEALVVGNRILLLSPHPGRVRAEINSHQFDLRSAGSAEFQAADERIHRLLFGEAATRVDARAPQPLSAVHALNAFQHPPIRPEYELALRRRLHRPRSGAARRCRQATRCASATAWLRKAGILLVLAVIWEGSRAGRTTTCCCRPALQTARALVEASSPASCSAISASRWRVLLQGYCWALPAPSC